MTIIHNSGRRSHIRGGGPYLRSACTRVCDLRLENTKKKKHTKKNLKLGVGQQQSSSNPFTPHGVVVGCWRITSASASAGPGLGVAAAAAAAARTALTHRPLCSYLQDQCGEGGASRKRLHGFDSDRLMDDDDDS